MKTDETTAKNEAPDLPARQFGICSPWEMHAKKLEALFKFDPDVTVRPDFGGAERTVRVLVKGEAKADALSRLLPAAVTFGKVEVAVKVLPANESPTVAETLEAAFKGNGAFVAADETPATGGAPALTFGIFAARPAQFWADNLGDPNGNVTILYQDLATELLTGKGARGALFSTAEL